jgi:predicted O-methyltransferase YrrM
MSVKGFFTEAEGQALMRMATRAPRHGPIVEIGSYCGRSTLYLGAVARWLGTHVVAVDHHRGSEEMGPDWPHFDPEVWDDAAGTLDSLPHFRRTLRRADLEEVVIPLVTRSDLAARYMVGEARLIFIDGGHGEDVAWSDWRAWGGRVVKGGFLAIHDVFQDPSDGGRPPYDIMQAALASGLYAFQEQVDSLAFLKRL